MGWVGMINTTPVFYTERVLQLQLQFEILPNFPKENQREN